MYVPFVSSMHSQHRVVRIAMIRTPCMGIKSLWTWPRLNSCRDTPFWSRSHNLGTCPHREMLGIWGAQDLGRRSYHGVQKCNQPCTLVLPLLIALSSSSLRLPSPESSGPFRVQPPSYDAPMWWTGNAHPAASCAAELPQARSLCSSLPLPPVSDDPHQLRACDSG